MVLRTVFSFSSAQAQAWSDGTVFDDGFGWHDIGASGVGSALILKVGGLGQGTFGSSFTGPLDSYTTGLAAACSMCRRLLSSYTGPLFQVETSDTGNATTNIGYDSNNVTDEAALAAAITGANDGRVLRIYDQSGNGRDLIWFGSKTRCVIGGVIQKSGNRVVTKAGANADPGNCFSTASFAAYTGTTISGYAGRDFIGSEQAAVLCAVDGAAHPLAWAVASSVILLTRGAASADTLLAYRSGPGNLISATAVSSGYWSAGTRLSGSTCFFNTDGVETTGNATSGALNVTQILFGTQRIDDTGAGGGCTDTGGLLGEAAVWFSDLGTTNLNAVVLNHKTFMAS